MAVLAVAAVCDGGESVAVLLALLQHCDRTENLLTIGIKYAKKVMPFHFVQQYFCADVIVLAACI